MILILLALALLQDPTPASLIEKLRSDNVAEREEAGRKLKALGRAAIPDLERAAKDPDRDVAGRAQSLLRVIRMAERFSPALRAALPGVEGRLTGDDEAWTREFLKAVELASTRNDLGSDDLEPLAGPALRHAAADQVLKVITGIAENSLCSAGPELLGLLEEPSKPGSEEASEALRHLPLRSLVPTLLEKLRNLRQPGRSRMIQVLHDWGATEAIPDLLKVVEGSAREPRRQALQTLGDWGRSEALAVLLKQPETPDEPDVIDALGRIGDAQAIPYVLSAMKKSPWPSTKLWGYDAVVRLEAKEAIPLLRDLLALPKLGYPGEALRALRFLSPEDAKTVCAKYFESPQAELRSLAVGEWGRLGMREQVPVLVKLLDDPNADLRHTAMRVLVRLDARDQVDAIAARLTTKDDLIPAARALASLGAAAKVDSSKLLPGLQDGDPWSRYGAIETLEKLRAADRLADVLPFLKSDKYFLRYKAAWTVGVLAGKESLEQLRPLLKDSNCLVRYYTAEALCEAGLVEGAATLIKEARDRQNPHKFGDLTVTAPRSCRILNSLRRPEDWKKLGAAKLPVLPRGTRREHLELLARELGLKAEFPEGLDDAWLSGRPALDLFDPPSTVMDGLLYLLQGTKIMGFCPRFEMILEEDRLRILPYLDALRFWQSWARERAGR